MPRFSTSLWSAINASTLAEVESSRWRIWPGAAQFSPVRDRNAAVAHARALARSRGVGYVIELRVDPKRFASLDQRPLESAELETALVAAIMEDARYCAAVPEMEIARAERHMGLRFPAAWRAYLQREVWFHRGHMSDGNHVRLYDPGGTVESWDIWNDLELADRPGMLVIGSDGASELITIDARDPRSRVFLTNNVSEGWQDSIVQADTIEAFVDAVENGTFAYRFDA